MGNGDNTTIESELAAALRTCLEEMHRWGHHSFNNIPVSEGFKALARFDGRKPARDSLKSGSESGQKAWMVVCVGSRHLFFERSDAELFAGDPSSRIVPLCEVPCSESTLHAAISDTRAIAQREFDKLPDDVEGEDIIAAVKFTAMMDAIDNILKRATAVEAAMRVATPKQLD